MLAYSSIAHAGYMMFAFVDTTGGRVSICSGSRASMLMVITPCASFQSFVPRRGRSPHSFSPQTRPVAALIFGLAMLSLAGLPPLPGFFAKLFVFRSAIASGYLCPPSSRSFGVSSAQFSISQSFIACSRPSV
jgi:NADH-quinone oxidoreductase subunit N